MRPIATAARDLMQVPCAPDRARRSIRWAVWACLLGVGLLATSCSVVSHGTKATKSVIDSLAGIAGEAAKTNAVAALQGEVMREADQYVGAVAQATDDFSKQVGTAEARDLAQQWKLNEATVAYVNATDENPLLGAVGMVVLASFSSMVVEDYWVGEKFGARAQPLLETHRQLESNAWSLVCGVLTPDQEHDLRKLLRDYHEKYPHLRYISAVRLPELVGKLGKVPTPNDIQKPGSLFGLLYLNPLAGLDPTTQAIQQTRLLAQRMMYYAQRAPMLLSWQVELTMYQLAAQPETKQLLSDVNDAGQSTKVFAKTAAELPQLVNDQREAAINQFFAGIAEERTNILTTLNAQEAQLHALLPEVQRTLTAGGDMANSLNAAIQSLNAFVQYVDPPDTNSLPQPADTNSPPFNILDYGTAASQIGAAADKLNALVVSLNQSLPQVTKLSEQAALDGKAVVNHAFRLGLVLVAFLGVVAVLVVLTCRRLG
ncbi:MAG: hypothetical protein IT579_20170 [Verrucomicrobia subdivision 3 bacterium]|nr:hypothetical protein [Limisphaerales bacterium]